MRLTLPVLGLCLVATAAAAQSNAVRVVNGEYTRSHDYDLIHQRIALADFNWDSTSFRGAVTTTVVSRRAGLDSLVLDEGALLHNTRVTGPHGRLIRTARHGDTLVVFPAAPVAFGDTLRFTVTYDGRVANGRGLTFISPDGLAHRPRQLWSQGEAMNNHLWFPTYDFPNDKESWELSATVDRGDVVVSNGRLVSDVRHGDRHTVTWREDRPSATYLVSMVIGPFARIHDSWKGVPVDYYVYHADSANAWRLFHHTPDMIDTYSRLTGVQYPWAKYAQTTVADFFGGMENVSATTLVDWLPGPHDYQDRPWYLELLIPHELAHQWFGDYVTTEDWANLWLNEGFAEFMPGQYWIHARGEHAAEDYYDDEYHQYVAIDARRPMALASEGSNNIYPKGALVLRMLENYLGPTRFWASLHTYLTRHAFGNATSDDLRQAVLQATGENLDWFWSEWVYSAGYPKLDVSATYDTTAHALHLDVRQTQLDTLHAGSDGVKFDVPEVFHMPFTIRVGTANGDVVTHATLDARHQTITVPGVRSAPTMVIFDDGNHVLKQLTFHEPTAWLATQLTRDANLWNREWVIGQLAQRATDTVAIAALAERGGARRLLSHAPTGGRCPGQPDRPGGPRRRARGVARYVGRRAHRGRHVTGLAGRRAGRGAYPRRVRARLQRSRTGGGGGGDGGCRLSPRRRDPRGGVAAAVVPRGDPACGPSGHRAAERHGPRAGRRADAGPRRVAGPGAGRLRGAGRHERARCSAAPRER